jgi:hypothetical protein
MYMNDLPQIINAKAIPIIFADDTSIILHPETESFQNCMNNAFLAWTNGLKQIIVHYVFTKQKYALI